MDLNTNLRKRRLLEEAVSNGHTSSKKRDAATLTDGTKPMALDMYTQTDNSYVEEPPRPQDFQNQINQIFHVLSNHQQILNDIRNIMSAQVRSPDSGHGTSSPRNVNYTIVTSGDDAISIEPVKPEDIIEEPVSSPMEFNEEEYEESRTNTSTQVSANPAPPTLLNSSLPLYQNAHCSKTIVHEMKNEPARIEMVKYEQPKIIQRCPLTERRVEPENSQQQSSLEMVTIGPNNTLVLKAVLDSIKWNSASGATRKLLATLFSREELATHSLTGRPSPAFHGRDKPAKNQLDPARVADIISIVSRCCNVSEKEVRNAITTKCADENKMYNQRLRREQRQDNKENIKANTTI